MVPGWLCVIPGRLAVWRLYERPLVVIWNAMFLCYHNLKLEREGGCRVLKQPGR